MKVKILGDSTCDLSKELLDKYSIDIIPFYVILGDRQLKDGLEVSAQDIIEYNKTSKNFPKTTAPNIGEYIDFFKKYVDEGYDIVYIGISSLLSSSFNNMTVAAGEFKNVHFVDGKSLSTGTGLLLLEAAEMAQKGKSAIEIKNEIEKLVSKVQASFVVEKLDYLRKGGRCSMLAALGANLLKIKPTLILKDGKIQKDKSFFGNHVEVMKKYVKYIFEKFNNINKKRIFITHSPSKPEYIQAVREQVSAAGFSEVIETNAGSTVMCHCGPNTIGILYLTK